MPNTIKQYVIWSNEHRMWWRANNHGYCTDIGQAGIYMHGDALDIVENATMHQDAHKEALNELAICIDDLPEHAKIKLGVL